MGEQAPIRQVPPTHARALRALVLLIRLFDMARVTITLIITFPLSELHQCQTHEQEMADA